MRIFTFISIVFILLGCGNSESNLSYEEALLKERKETNKAFANPSSSPLPKNEIKSFVSLNYFPIDSNLRVKAEIIKIDTAAPFQMPTTTLRLPTYQKVAIAIFSVDQVQDTLAIYKNLDDPEDDVLFIPFLDETNGFESYGGGRYLDLEDLNKPVYIDFNRAYNPYCAYNHDFSCPIPPLENQLTVRIEAGEKSFKAY